MLLVLAAASLAGCAEIDQARRAQDPDNRRFGERTISAAEAGLSPGSTLTVPQGVDITLRYNPTIATGRARVDLAQAALEQANAGGLPLISVSADYRWERSGGAGSTPRSGQKVGNSGFVQTTGGGVQFSQLLFDWGKTGALQKEAYHNFVAAQSDLAATENDAVFTFKQAFFDALKQEELVRVGEETVRQFEKRLEQVRGFVEAGTRQKYDLTKAQVDLGGAQFSLVKARTALTVARASLNASLGLASEPVYTIDRATPPGTWTMTFDDAVEAARTYHPRLRGLLLRETAARSVIDAAIADFFPALTLQGAFSWSGGLTPLNYFAFIGPALNWVIYSGGETTARLHAAVANLHEAYSIRALEEQTLFLELRQGYASLEDTRESLKIAALTVKSAEETLELVTGRFQVGKASSVELTDAQVALANARAAEIQSRFDFEISIAAIERSIGGARKP